MKARTVGIALATFLSAGAALAQPACCGDEVLMSWPDADPVWQFCWLRPPDSSGPNGSGLEISNVYYNGHLVMRRGHVPDRQRAVSRGRLRSVLSRRMWSGRGFPRQ